MSSYDNTDWWPGTDGLGLYRVHDPSLCAIRLSRIRSKNWITLAQDLKEQLIPQFTQRETLISWRGSGTEHASYIECDKGLKYLGDILRFAVLAYDHQSRTQFRTGFEVSITRVAYHVAEESCNGSHLLRMAVPWRRTSTYLLSRTGYFGLESLRRNLNCESTIQSISMTSGSHCNSAIQHSVIRHQMTTLVWFNATENVQCDAWRFWKDVNSDKSVVGNKCSELKSAERRVEGRIARGDKAMGQNELSADEMPHCMRRESLSSWYPRLYDF